MEAQTQAYIASRQPELITSACYTVVFGDGSANTFCSPAVYMDMMAGTDGRLSTNQDSRRLPTCYGTKEAPQEQPQEGDNEKPKAHSEIAAMQDLFGISGGLNYRQWANAIVRSVKDDMWGARTLKTMHVWLYNSANPPCHNTDTGNPAKKGSSRHRALPDRCPCHRFLDRVARLVTDRKFPMYIHVISPGPTHVVYPLDASPDRVSAPLDGSVERIPGNGMMKSHSHRTRPHLQPDDEERDPEMELIEAILDLLHKILLDC